MKYASTKKINLDFNGEKKDIYTIVINNPCKKNDFPELAAPPLMCSRNIPAEPATVTEPALAEKATSEPASADRPTFLKLFIINYSLMFNCYY